VFISIGFRGGRGIAGLTNTQKTAFVAAMHRITPLLLLAAACGDTQAPAPGEATTAIAAGAITLGCETNLDAGVPCEPCPGNIRSIQTDFPGDESNGVPIPLRDGGMTYILVYRQCDCPPPMGRSCGVDDAGVVHACPGLIWPSCPSRSGQMAPPATCASIAAEFQRVCAVP
jgi:hypothetical protein